MLTCVKDDGFQDEVQVEEPVEALSTPVEPSTGEKRPRTDEDDEIRNTSGDSRAHAAAGNPPAHHKSDMTAPQDAAMNGTYQHASGGHGHGSGNVDPSMTGYDALYIGDLQWVRFLSLGMPLVDARLFLVDDR